MEEKFIKKNIVLTGLGCNSNCIFCLQTARNPSFFSSKNIFKEIVEGRNRGANWLVLTGGEASIHPDFVEFVSFAKKIGYERIQTISNGRMFSIKSFVKKVALAGLTETTISLHAATAEKHDGLTRTPGSFKQASIAAKNCEEANIHLSFNTAISSLNVLELKNILEYIHKKLGFSKYDYDLIGTAPSGGTWDLKLMPDHDKLKQSLREVCEYAQKNNIVMWVTRTPIQDFPKGYEHHKEPWEVIAHEMVAMWDMVWIHPKKCESKKCEYCEVQPYCRPTQDLVLKIKEKNLNYITGTPTKEKLKLARELSNNFKIEKLEDFDVVKLFDFEPFFIIYFDGFNNFEDTLKLAEKAKAKGVNYHIEFQVNKKSEAFTKKFDKHPIIFSPTNPYKHVKYFFDKSNYLVDTSDSILPFSKMNLEGEWKNVPLCMFSGQKRQYGINLDDFDKKLNPKKRDFAERLTSDTRVYEWDCFNCSLKPNCPGFFGDYVKLFGFEKVKPVK
ncbi:MAG: radical SAM protein [Candidatus Altiarchaeota archaeon]|nr:radical SAM protein [Candidatus Altiarchaeota archaeon]